MSVETSIARLEEKVEALKEAIEYSGKVQADSYNVLKDQLEKADTTLVHRLSSMNSFREQINIERNSYVTNEKLDLRLKPWERMFWGLSAIVALISVVILPLLIIWFK